MARENSQPDHYRYDATGQLISVEYGRDTGDSPVSNMGILPKGSSDTGDSPVGSSGMGDSPMGSSNMGILPMSESFTYDPLGNRTTHAAISPDSTPETTHYQTNNLNQYTQITSSSSTANENSPLSLGEGQGEGLHDSANAPPILTPDSSILSYDSNGNLTNDGTQLYRYDAQNRLIEVESATTKAIFAYDARNRCVLRQYYNIAANGDIFPDETTSVVMTYDIAWNLLVDRDMSGNQKALYVHGVNADEILANIQTAKTYYPHADALDSVIALSSDNGIKEAVVKYTAFGLSLDAPAYHRFLYTGREWLADVGLNEHRNRYYNPSSGRWLTTDPIGLSDDCNLYRYAYNDGINNPDNKDPYNDPWVLDQPNNDFHAVKKNSDGTLSYFPGDYPKSEKKCPVKTSNPQNPDSWSLADSSPMKRCCSKN